MKFVFLAMRPRRPNNLLRPEELVVEHVVGAGEGVNQSLLVQPNGRAGGVGEGRGVGEDRNLRGRGNGSDDGVVMVIVMV